MSIVNLFSPNWHEADSYGRIAHELSAGMEANGYTVNKFGVDAPKAAIKPCMGGIFLGYPTMHNDWIKQFWLAGMGSRLAVTMFESTKLLDGWCEALNECHRVIVPAHYLVDVFKRSGVGSPIDVIPLGMSKAFIDAFAPRLETTPTEDNPFTFICIGDRGSRKNWQQVIFAFVRAFGEDKRYKLIIKSRAMPFNISNPNVELIAEDYSDAEMAALYRKCHVMVFPSSGEGFGLPPREFAATGGVVLATDWGGTADDIQYWGIPLPYQLTTAWSDNPEWFGKLGEWAAVETDVLSEQMRFIVDNYGFYRDFGVRAAGFVRGQYRWQTFANHVQSAWEEIVKDVAHANNEHRKEPVTA